MISAWFLWTPAAIGCKAPDFDVWAKMTAKELEKYGCIRDQVKLEIASRNEQHATVLNLARRIRKLDRLDGPTLEREAKSLYATASYSEALKVYLQSRSKERKCEVFVKCPTEFDKALSHYELATYYRSAGDATNAEREILEGESELTRMCQSASESDHCDYIRARFRRYYEIQLHRHTRVLKPD